MDESGNEKEKFDLKKNLYFRQEFRMVSISNLHLPLWSKTDVKNEALAQVGIKACSCKLVHQ